MTEGILEILRILAYLSIGLISIVVATYAISVSYLGRETHRSLWRKKKRQDELKRKLKELGQKPDVEGIVEEINSYKKEIHELNNRLFYLSVYGAVVAPCILGLIALVFAGYNIYVNPPTEIRNLLILGAVTFIAGGFFCLIKTLFAIEWAASRIPLPKFNVHFEHGVTVKECKVKAQEQITFCVHNIGEEMAENVQIYLQFPPVFSIQRKPKSYRITLQDETTDHPNYNAVTFDIDRIHIDIISQVDVLLKMPKEAGSYIIPVDIHERKVGESKHKLTLEIIE